MISIYGCFNDKHEKKDKKCKYQEEHQLGIELLKYGLYKEYGVRLEGEDLDKTSKGKPYLSAHPDLHFNISHSRELVLCGIAKEPLGLDTEKVREFPQKLMSKVLSQEEQLQFLKVEDQRAREELFFRFWTLKEAYVKYLGVGMSLGLDKITFHLNPLRIAEESVLEFENRELCFHQRYCHREYLISLCSKSLQEVRLQIIPRETFHSPE